MQITYERKEEKISHGMTAWKIILSYIICSGFIFEMCSIVKNNLTSIHIVMGLGMIFIILNMISYKHKILRSIAVIISIMTVLMQFIIYGITTMYGGLLYIINCYIARINVRRNAIIDLFSENKANQIGVFPVLVILTVIMAIVISELINKNKITLMAVIIFIVCVFNVIFNTSNYVGATLYISGISGMQIIRYSNVFRKRFLFFTSLYFAVFLTSAIIAKNSDVTKITTMREDANEIIENIRFGRDSLLEGNLRNCDKLKDGNEETLEVTTTYAKVLYLKGFVGSVYSNGKWKKLPNDVYSGKNNGMLEWLKKNNLEPEYQYSAYEDVSKDKGIVENYVHIKNIGAKRNYIYLPYSAEKIDKKGIYSDYDYNEKSKLLLGEGEYEFIEKSYNLPSELITLDESYDKYGTNEEELKYKQAENVYRQFVYDNYLEANEEFKNIVNEIFWEDADEQDTASMYFITQRIRKVMEDNFIYNDKMERIPSAKDPLMYFLTETREGNSALYASAAVMAYREAGIPARYVEGYYCNNKENKKSKMTLTSKDAHVWVEIYMDGIGWLPVDVTPGYYYDVYELMNISVSASKIERTVSTDESGKEEKLNENNKIANKNRKKSYIVWNKLISGICIVIFMIIVIRIVIYKIVKAIGYCIIKIKYKKATEYEKSKILIDILFKILNRKGIKAEIGWQPEQTEKEIISKYKEFYEGEYLRVYSIAEKVTYGEEEMQLNEKRVVASFIERIFNC